MTPRDQWLTQIRRNPSDWESMLVFADWLEDDGDLLAAEQWRWIAVVDGANAFLCLCDEWPQVFSHITDSFLLKHESRFRSDNNIRCMPTYPKNIEDVERYYQTQRP